MWYIDLGSLFCSIACFCGGTVTRWQLNIRGRCRNNQAYLLCSLACVALVYIATTMTDKVVLKKLNCPKLENNMDNTMLQGKCGDQADAEYVLLTLFATCFQASSIHLFKTNSLYVTFWYLGEMPLRYVCWPAAVESFGRLVFICVPSNIFSRFQDWLDAVCIGKRVTFGDCFEHTVPCRGCTVLTVSCCGCTVLCFTSKLKILLAQTNLYSLFHFVRIYRSDVHYIVSQFCWLSNVYKYNIFHHQRQVPTFWNRTAHFWMYDSL